MFDYLPILSLTQLQSYATIFSRNSRSRIEEISANLTCLQITFITLHAFTVTSFTLEISAFPLCKKWLQKSNKSFSDLLLRISMWINGIFSFYGWFIAHPNNQRIIIPSTSNFYRSFTIHLLSLQTRSIPHLQLGQFLFTLSLQNGSIVPETALFL